MTPHSGYPSVSGEVCCSFQSGMWLIWVVCAQTPPTMWDWSERTVGSIGREQGQVSEWVGCEHASSQIQSRSNVGNLLLIFPRRSSQYLTSYFSWREVFSCFSYALHKRQLFTPPQQWIHTRSVCEVQYTRSRALWWQWARQLHWAFADESLLLLVSYQLISGSAVLQMPFFPSTDFPLELQETVIPGQRCAAFLRPVWLPLDRFRLAGAQEIWVLGKPWGLINQGMTRLNIKNYLTKGSNLELPDTG